MRAKRFEDLYFWQKARDLAKLVYRITEQERFEADIAFRDQFRQAGFSPMGEIAFGFAQGDAEEFRDSLDISRGDLMRVKSLTYLARELGFLEDSQVEEIMICIQEVERLMTGFVRGMRSRHRGEIHHDEHFAEHSQEHEAEFRGNSRATEPEESFERSYRDDPSTQNDA